ncbi:hypothetical protein C0J52_09807 [Blattella germanica]|nr:hypothetical protein C0J52_09807 [Blattella germanica]
MRGRVLLTLCVLTLMAVSTLANKKEEIKEQKEHKQTRTCVEAGGKCFQFQFWSSLSIYGCCHGLCDLAGNCPPPTSFNIQMGK